MHHVPDWKKKRHYLVRDRLPRAVSRDRIPPDHVFEIETIDNVEKLARVVGVNRTTIYAAPSEAIVLRVKALYLIEPDSDCEGEFNVGSAEDFIDEYRALHEGYEKANPPAVRAPPTKAAIPAATVLLKEDLNADAESMQTELASLSLWTGQSEPTPGEAKLGFNLNCPDMATDGLTTGVKRGVLTFRCGDGHTTEAKDRTGYPGGVAYNGAKFTPLSVSKNEPSWLVTATAGAAIGIVGDAPPDFIRILNLMPGASVGADFTAPVREIETTFVLPQGQDQSAAKRKIKKRLRELKLPGGEEGIAKLASAEIRFAARED
jgi:hypothetical protein